MQYKGWGVLFRTCNNDELSNSCNLVFISSVYGEDLGGMLILCCHWVVKEFATSKLDGLTFCVLMIFYAPLRLDFLIAKKPSCVHWIVCAILYAGIGN